MPEQRYLVTARKYRPKLFGELVAQEHVTETLKNAIRLDRLAHAYLFSGPRGVGKTTAARILAKAINCTTPLEDRPDQAEPCRTCSSCRSFEEGGSLNIFEIDAASNNKVEDIRELRETVRIPPQGSRKKVYIIDEVHMLSNAAFNALLKTLEEPPPHVLFIFATTEPHKVLPTILSRCQRFDFRRIPVPEIVARLQEICDTEGINADEASLMLIARKGDGALRDALSAFDQAVSLCGTDLRYAELASALRVVDVDLFFEVTQYVSDHNAAGMLHLVDRVVSGGYDLQEFLGGLTEHLRNLLVACTTGETTLIEAAEQTRRRYAEVARSFEEVDLLRLLMLVDAAEESIKNSTQPRMKLEMALLKMATLHHAADLREVLRRLDHLESLAGDAPDRPAERERAKPTPTVTGSASSGNPPAEGSSDPERHSASRAVESRPAKAEAKQSGGHEREEMTSRSVKPAVPASPPSPSSSQASKPSRPTAEQDEQQKPAYTDLFPTPALKQRGPRNAVSSARQAQVSSTPAGAQDSDVAMATPPDLERITELWPSYVEAIKEARIHVGALLQHTKPLEASFGELVIGVPDSFHRRLLENQHDFLLQHLNDVSADDFERLSFTICDTPEAEGPVEMPSKVDPVEYMQRKRQESPVVRAIFEQFGGELVW